MILYGVTKFPRIVTSEDAGQVTNKAEGPGGRGEVLPLGDCTGSFTSKGTFFRL